MYHAWKAKNRKRTTMDENERAPRSVMDAANRTPRLQQKNVVIENSQRYFRIPFIRPNTVGGDQSKRGWWFAHFDGQYVARQMELHPEKPPVLLIAGQSVQKIPIQCMVWMRDISDSCEENPLQHLIRKICFWPSLTPYFKRHFI